MSGPFAHSRNPIYLANVMLTVGFGFALGSRWFLLGAVVLFFLLLTPCLGKNIYHVGNSHTWDFTDQPLPYQAFLDGRYVDNGVRVSWLAPTDLYVDANKILHLHNTANL